MTHPQSPRPDEHPPAAPTAELPASAGAPSTDHGDPSADGENGVAGATAGPETPQTPISATEDPSGPVTEVPRRRAGRRRVALVSAVAVGVLLVGGGGGFAIGRATAPDTAVTSTTGDQQFPGDGGPRGTPPDGGDPRGAVPDQDGTTDDGTSEPTA